MEKRKKLNVREAAARLGLVPAYIYQLIAKDPTFPYHKRPGKGQRGGGVWFDPDEIDRWEDSGRDNEKA
jgi:predicted DNA-binding transcriptional regulator AlpA